MASSFVGGPFMYMLIWKFILWVMETLARMTGILCFKFIAAEDEDRSQCLAKTTTNFGEKNGENLYYKKYNIFGKKGGGQFDTFGDFVTRGALERAEARTSLTDTSGWMITVNTYDFVYLAFCVLLKTINSLSFPPKLLNNVLRGRCQLFSHSLLPLGLTDWPRKTSPVRS